MSIFLVGSLRGSPGVTTTSVLLADCFERGVLVEADRDGGVLAVRYGLGREPGLTTLAGARSGTGWQAHAQSVGGVPVLVGPESGERTGTLWAHAGSRLVGALADDDATAVDAVVDVGRFAAAWPPTVLANAAAVVVVVVRPVAEQLVALGEHVDRWSAAGWPSAVVLTGGGSYRPGDVTSELGVPVLGVLPTDRRAASIVTDGGNRRLLARSALARAARTLADALAACSAPVRSALHPAPINGEVSG